jgi:hypothetical protein
MLEDAGRTLGGRERDGGAMVAERPAAGTGVERGSPPLIADRAMSVVISSSLTDTSGERIAEEAGGTLRLRETGPPSIKA